MYQKKLLQPRTFHFPNSWKLCDALALSLDWALEETFVSAFLGLYCFHIDGILEDLTA